MRSTSSRLALCAFALAASFTVVFPGIARGSELIDRNASDVRLAVSRHGEALLTYRARGQARRVLVWGAVNALAPTRARRQVAFKLDYSGGGRSFRNACAPYDGPVLAWLVTACRAPDGSYWAVQSWQRALPNYGLAPPAQQSAWELRISRWTGPLAKLEVGLDWIYGGRFHHIFGRLTYRGQPVHGFASTRTGVTLDTFGRNLYLDTYNSAYGAGWRRENSFLAHNPNGNFCYGFYAHRRDPRASGRALVGKGQRYRISVIGPGVTPDIVWQGRGLEDFDARSATHVTHERAMNRLRAEFAGGDRLCRQN